MLSKFFGKKISLVTETFAFFSSKGKFQKTRYTPLPQTIPKERVRKFEKGVVHKFNRFSVTPHTYWITQGKGTERPFTGKYWDTKDLGQYECAVCSNKLFLSDHKFFPPTGIASFWTSVTGAVELVDDLEDVKPDKGNLTSRMVDHDNAVKRVTCSNCHSHLGTLHHDGPPPTFQRFSINSGAVDFFEKPWFHPPQYYKVLREEYHQRRRKLRKQRTKQAHAKLGISKKKFKVSLKHVATIEADIKLPPAPKPEKPVRRPRRPAGEQQQEQKQE